MFGWKLNRIKYKLPNIRIGKTHLDNRNARLVDIDSVIEETNTVLQEVDTEVTALKDDQPLYGEFTLTLADMNAGGTHLAFPALGVGSSYVWEKCIIEANQSDVTVPANTVFIMESNMGGVAIDADFVNNEVGESNVNVRQVSPSPGVATTLIDSSHLATYNAEANYQNGTDRVTVGFLNDQLSPVALTGGTAGSVLIKFWYKIETNGSNL